MSAKDSQNLTPEEKLLKIIENPTEAPAGKISFKAAEKGSAVNLSALVSRFRRLHISKDTLLEYANIWTANKALAGVCIVLTVFWIIDFVSSGLNFNKRLEALVKEGSMVSAAGAARVFAGVDIKDVLSMSKRRNIFTLLPPKQEIIQTQALEQAVSNYKLVGIIWSDNPQAMIEDSKAGKTNLFNENEIMGDFKIKKVYRDKVVLSKDAMEWELR